MRIDTGVSALRGARKDLQAQLDRACIDRPDDTEEHQRIIRILAWNRMEINRLTDTVRRDSQRQFLQVA